MRKQAKKLALGRLTVSVLTRVSGGDFELPTKELRCDEPVESFGCPSDAIGCQIKLPATLQSGDC